MDSENVHVVNKELGHYFTPRKVCKYLVKVCNSKVKQNNLIETILDPSMGTGGFSVVNTMNSVNNSSVNNSSVNNSSVNNSSDIEYEVKINLI